MNTINHVKACKRSQVMSVLMWGCLCLHLPWTAVQAKLDVAVEADTILVGESFVLTVTTDQMTDTSPDFSPLEKHFEVLSTSEQKSVKWIDGTALGKHQWRVQLRSMTRGHALIPSLTIAGESSDELHIEVHENHLVKKLAFMTTHIANSEPYVQSQLTYKVRIYTQVNLRYASLGEPKLDGAVVKLLGKDRRSEAVSDGETYHVIERQFGLFPQRSGSFVIQPPPLDVVIAQQFNHRGVEIPRRLLNKQIRLPADAIEVHVQPAPEGVSPWLPAWNMVLSHALNRPEKVLVGEPVSLTLQLTAQGLSGEQLPTIDYPLSDDWAIYPNEAKRFDRDRDGDIEGRMQQTLVFIPKKTGDLVIPPYQLSWFNLNTQALETVRIAGISIRVHDNPNVDVMADWSTLPSSNEAQQQASPTGDDKDKPTDSVSTQTVVAPQEPAVSVDTMQSQWWFYVVGLLLSLSVAFWWYKRRRSAKHKPDHVINTKAGDWIGVSNDAPFNASQQQQALKQHWQRLQQHSRQLQIGHHTSFQDFHRSIKQWCHLLWDIDSRLGEQPHQKPHTLSDWGGWLEQRFALSDSQHRLLALDAQLYGSEPQRLSESQQAQLIRQLQQWVKQLKPIYKTCLKARPRDVRQQSLHELYS